jgi:hypothetical protein
MHYRIMRVPRRRLPLRYKTVGQAFSLQRASARSRQ